MGGYVAAIRAAQLGRAVAVVEAGKLGGVCLHRGCIPTKALLHHADLYSLFGRAADFGFHLPDPHITYDFPAIQTRVGKTVAQLERGVGYLLKKNNITHIQGFARLPGFPSGWDGNLEVAVRSPDGTPEDEQLITGQHIVVATGSRWLYLPGLPVDSTRVLDADGALALDHIPASAVIVGGGQTGIEFAALWSAFGSKVTLIEAEPTILPAEEREIATKLDQFLSRKGTTIITGTRLEAGDVEVGENGVAVTIKGKRIEAEVLLQAVGRRGSWHGVNLERFGALADSVTHDDGTDGSTSNTFLPVDDAMRVRFDGEWAGRLEVYAIGDVTGGFGFDGSHRYLLAHAAAAQGIYLVEKLFGNAPDPINYHAIARCTYTSPQIASLGLTEAQAKAQGRNVKTGVFAVKANGRALMMGESEGMAKIVADTDTDDVLGVHIIAPNATELIGAPQTLMMLNGSAWELSQVVAAHPTLSEIWMEAARAVGGAAIHG